MSGDMRSEARLLEGRWGESEDTKSDAAALSLPAPKRLAILLESTIEKDVIPRLLARHGLSGDDGSRQPPPLRSVSQPDSRANLVERIAQKLLTASVEETRQLAHEILKSGDHPAIMLEVLAPAARRLGQLWDTDDASFGAVVGALLRLHLVLRSLGDDPTTGQHAGRTGSILLVTLPGDRHLFGATMVETFFREAGWTVAVLFGDEREKVLDVAMQDGVDMIGISLGRSDLGSELSSLIADLRAINRPTPLSIIVGGPALNAEPSLCETSGADGWAPDGAAAVNLAESTLRNGDQARRTRLAGSGDGKMLTTVNDAQVVSQ